MRYEAKEVRGSSARRQTLYCDGVEIATRLVNERYSVLTRSWGWNTDPVPHLSRLAKMLGREVDTDQAFGLILDRRTSLAGSESSLNEVMESNEAMVLTTC